jgi:D-alanyl-D-alanine carboxypeptidase
MKRSLIFILLCLFSSALKAQDLTKFADSLMKVYQIPELGFAVLKADTILEMKTLGYHRNDLENETNKAIPSDYFHLGSNTKAITGFIAAWLVEHKKLLWTTKFFDLFPELKKSSNPAYLEITLADLLSHRANIQPFLNGEDFKKLPLFEGNVASRRKLFAAWLLKQAPVQVDAVPYHYSNAGYSVATLMLEKVSGKTWEELVEEVIHQQLKLNYRMGWPNLKDPNQPWGHWMDNAVLVPVKPDVNYKLALVEPAGDISMPLPDYAKFIQMNLQGLTGKDNFLKAETYKYLHFGIKDYSIGWINTNTDQVQVSDHTGSAGTFFSYAFLYASKNTAYIILINNGTPKGEEGLFKFLDAMVQKYNFSN